MKTVNQSMRKKDAMQLVTGQPVYMDDVIPQDCLIVKLLRSPQARPTPSRAPMTGLSSTAMSALRGMLSQFWPARMKNASIRR